MHTNKQMATEVEAEYSGEVPGLESNLNDEEDHIEQMLSEKLMQGYILLEKSCPTCATPLVKQVVEEDSDHRATKAVDTPVLVSSQSFDQPFRPVAGVPFCVACQSHVVTEEAEISILERCDSLKHRGSILVALKGDSVTDDASQPHHDTVPEQDDQREIALTPGVSPRSSLEENKPTMVEYEEQDSPASQQHDEKKEDEPLAVTPLAVSPAISHETGMVMDHDNDADDIMAEYSVR